MLGRVIEDDFNICMNFWCWAHECSGEWVFFSLFVAGKRMKKTIETESLQMMMRDCSIAVEIALLISQQLENFLCFPFKSSRAFLLHNYFPLAHVNSSAINRRHCSMNHGLCEAIEREIFHVSSARGILKANFKFITFIKSHQVGRRRQRDGGKKLCVKLLLLLLSFVFFRALDDFAPRIFTNSHHVPRSPSRPRKQETKTSKGWTAVALLLLAHSLFKQFCL